MRFTVKASEVRPGDVLIVPDGELVVSEPRVSFCNCHLLFRIAPTPIVRHENELVVVERPERPVTITVELTPEEADAYVQRWAFADDDLLTASSLAMKKMWTAIQAARQ